MLGQETKTAGKKGGEPQKMPIESNAKWNPKEQTRKDIEWGSDTVVNLEEPQVTQPTPD